MVITIANTEHEFDCAAAWRIVGQMLARSGYTGIDRIFVSCKAGYSKSNGSLYRYVQQQLGCKKSAFVHIGDNLESDVNRAREAGWQAFYLPKASDCMINQAPGYRFSSLFNRLYRDDSGIRLASYGYDYYFGMRCRLAVAANRLSQDVDIEILDAKASLQGRSRLAAFSTAHIPVPAPGLYLIRASQNGESAIYKVLVGRR